MSGIVSQLWLVPTLPLVAAAVLALTPRPRRRLAAGLAIGAMAASLVLACLAFVATLNHPGEGAFRATVNFTWLQTGEHALQLGWVLDPLAAVMLVMVTFVGLLIFIYSVGYMAHDANATRFFCFLSLFAGAMLGVVIANSLLLLFACWELVGLASYLLIGFWYHKPEAAAAAKKAFITTRVGDIGLFLGLLWLYSASGTLVFYDHGNGCLEGAALPKLVAATTSFGFAVSTGIGLLIFCGAMGKSGQVPLHVWLPDAMEGPTPVSALIHAATMVAAGVFLVARVYPLMSEGLTPEHGAPVTNALTVVTWVGAITAFFAASIAVAQSDIKRILAYSTVSQLGFMMMGLGAGGVAVGMFHLLTHAVFKALLFLGSGSVIHGCHEEQDIRRMGGLRRLMPVTFATYAIGMLALAGFPLLFSGFWSKDEILHATHAWPVSHGPFWLGLAGALVTAFYMTRQMLYVFFGPHRGGGNSAHAATPHESPAVMTVPLGILAACAVLLGFLGTPAWPWLQQYLSGASQAGTGLDWHRLVTGGVPGIMLTSTGIGLAGLGLGWWIYGRRPITQPAAPDPLQLAQPRLFAWLRGRFFIDEFYAATLIRFNTRLAEACDLVDRWVWGGVVWVTGYAAQALSWAARLFDEYLVNFGFDAACRELVREGHQAAGLTDGRLHNYLRGIGTAVVCLLLLLTWGGCR